MNIALIAGARPNFIKAAPLWAAFQQQPGWKTALIHTGQHRDMGLSGLFFQTLNLPAPQVQISGSADTPVRQMARIMQGLEPVLRGMHPDWVVVIGDVNSTLAAALTAKQLGLRLAHVEAGLRSGDRSMPEELNRLAVDHWADLLLVSEPSGLENLQREGIPEARIHYSGNVLIDALVEILPKAENIQLAEVLSQAAWPGATRPAPSRFALCTFHRPANVDRPESLLEIVQFLERLSAELPVLFPVHPRTLKNLRQSGWLRRLSQNAAVWLLPPLGYAQMMALTRRAALVATDSGGLQEESSWLNVPCLTLRPNTERPATIQFGTNTLLAGTAPGLWMPVLKTILAGKYRAATQPPGWDGQAARRIAAALGGAVFEK